MGEGGVIAVPARDCKGAFSGRLVAKRGLNGLFILKRLYEGSDQGFLGFCLLLM